MKPMETDKLCQEECKGKCCSIFWIYTTDKNRAMRFEWLDTDKIEVKEVSKGLWKITFNFPCSKLDITEDKVSCSVHEVERPNFCEEFPRNFYVEPNKAAKEEMIAFCPYLAKLCEK